MKTARGIVPLLLFAAVMAAGAESLWSPDFKGYISGGRALAVGDVLAVEIDASSSLSFSSSSNDSKNLTIEFSGGETGNLFSFLPQLRTGGTQSTKGGDSMSLKAQIPVVVTGIAPDGRAQVQGSRTITVQGKQESITLTGLVSPKLIDQKGKIAFSQLSDSRLAYRTFLSSPGDVLSSKDLQELLTPAPAATPAAAGAAAAGTAAGTAAPASQPAPTRTLVIPDARKKELLLLYLNRLIDIIFAQ